MRLIVPSSDARFPTIVLFFVIDYVSLSRLILNSGCRSDNHCFDRCFARLKLRIIDVLTATLIVEFRSCKVEGNLEFPRQQQKAMEIVVIKRTLDGSCFISNRVPYRIDMIGVPHTRVGKHLMQ